MGETSRMGRYAELVALGAKHDMGWLFDRIGLGRFTTDDELTEAGDLIVRAVRDIRASAAV